MIAWAASAVIVLVIATFYWSKHRERGKEFERQKLREAVYDLPDWQPQLVILHVEDRYNYLEIAAKLEMPAQYVLNELAKAYTALRMRELEREPGKKRRRVRPWFLLAYRLIRGF